MKFRKKIRTSDYIHTSTVLHEKVVIIKEHQLHSHALHDHYLEGFFNSKFQSELNHQIKEEVNQEIFIKGIFLSPRTNADVQQYYPQDKVFQGCLSSLENDVVILFLNNLDMDKDFENSHMKTPNSGETLVEESRPSILIPEKKSFFHMIRDLETHYMGKVYDQNLPTIVDYNGSMSAPNLFTSDDVLQPWSLYDSRNPYYQTSQRLCQFFRSQRVESPKNKNTMEGVKHDGCFTHILKDPFAILLEEINSPNVFDFLRIMDEVLNELSVSKIWSKLVQGKQTMDKMLTRLHWHFDFT
jgi:hypothetical protein